MNLPFTMTVSLNYEADVKDLFTKALVAASEPSESPPEANAGSDAATREEEPCLLSMP